MKKILIGGGSGLVGSRLTELLSEKGYEVAHLSRSKESKGKVRSIHWDVNDQQLRSDDLDGFDVVINLAGAGIADEVWTEKRKKIIRDSRVNSNLLLKTGFEKIKTKPSFFISASAIGYYGLHTSDHIYKEEDQPGDDFLANSCVDWERSADEIAKLGIPIAKVRIGLVLTDKGGALAEIEKPFQWGLGAPLGDGKQAMPWIHIDDLCRIFIHILENQLEGVYNGVAPNGVNNREFTKELAKALNKKLLLPPVPGFMIKLMMGERANLVLKGSLVSSEKIEQANFQFKFSSLGSALKEIYL